MVSSGSALFFVFIGIFRSCKINKYVLMHMDLLKEQEMEKHVAVARYQNKATAESSIN